MRTIKEETITPRLVCRIVSCATGTFRTYLLDGKAVLRHDTGYEWFNHDRPSYIDCRETGNYDRSISLEEFKQLLEEMKQLQVEPKAEVVRYHIETYRMPVGCTSWITQNHFPHLEDEERVYGIWQGMVKEVKRDYPKARMVRSLRRRSADKAFCDRESSICNREWELSPIEGKYRVTMYVTKVA